MTRKTIVALLGAGMLSAALLVAAHVADAKQPVTPKKGERWKCRCGGAIRYFCIELGKGPPYSLHQRGCKNCQNTMEECSPAMKGE